MDPRFHKYLYNCNLCLVIVMMTIYKGLNEINLFFTEKLKFNLKFHILY